MKRKSGRAMLAVSLALSLAILACAGGGPAATVVPTAPPTAPPTAAPTQAATQAQSATSVQTPTEAPQVTATTAAEQATTAATAQATQAALNTSGTLDVLGLSSYLDSSQRFHVVGLFSNGTNQAVKSVELTLGLTDSTGLSVLLDSNNQLTDTVTFNPMLATVAAGLSSPFDYHLSVANGVDTTGWKFKLEVTKSNAGDVSQADVQVTNDQTAVDSSGTVFLTGELVNKTNQPVQINVFAAAMLDGPGKPVAADTVLAVTRILAASGDAHGSDRSPFVIDLSGPVKTGTTPAYYIDAVLAAAKDAGTAANIQLDLANTFVDGTNNVHVVASITNSGTETVTVGVVAGLYEKGGKVLDAAFENVQLYLAAGETSPVGFSFFPSVNGNNAAIARLDTYSVQVDPFWTFPTNYIPVNLEASNVTTSSLGAGSGEATIKGTVTNTTKKKLSSANVVVAVFSADGKLIAADFTGASPDSGAWAPGQKVNFQLTMQLPTSADPATVKFVTKVQTTLP
jgi:hypothetical protein